MKKYINKEKIGWGIIGCGDVTEVKSGPAFQKAKGSELVAVMRRNAEKAKDYAIRHKVPKWYDDADLLINDPDVDAVYIATPPDSHACYTIRALEAGKPVYVEKPMALNHSQCKEMIKKSEEKDLPLLVAYYRRSLEEFNLVKDIVDKGKIGNPRTICIKLHSAPKPGDGNTDKPWRVIPDIAGGGHFVDLASHQFDILQYFFGKIEKVSGFATNQAGLYSAEDTVSASFKFQKGLLGSGSWSFCVANEAEQDEIEITGTEGIVRFSSFNHSPIKLITKMGEETIDFDRPEHIQQPFIQSIVNKLLGVGETPADLAIAGHTSWVLENILAG